MDAMDRLIAQDEILRTVTLINKAEDDLDAELLKSCYSQTKNLTFDVSGHLEGIPPMEITPQQLWDESYRALAGFTATHHVWSNPTIDFLDHSCAKAEVNVLVIAYHCIEEGGLKSVTARGTQEFTMELEKGKWVCTRLAIKREVPLDNPKLYDVAKERYEKGLGRIPKT